MHRMIKIYNSLVLENENLSSNIDVLENDIEFSVRELALLVEQLKQTYDSEDKIRDSQHLRIQNVEKMLENYGVDSKNVSMCLDGG